MLTQISANMCAIGPTILAQATSGSRGTGFPKELLIWIGVLIVVVVIAGMVLVHVHKRMLKPPSQGQGAAGIMEELRRMRDSGAMTHEEYEVTRKAMARKLAPSNAGMPQRGSQSAIGSIERRQRRTDRDSKDARGHFDSGGDHVDTGFDSGGDSGGGDGGGD